MQKGATDSSCSLSSSISHLPHQLNYRYFLSQSVPTQSPNDRHGLDCLIRSPMKNIAVRCLSPTLLASAAFFFIYNLGSSSISSASDEVIYIRVSQGIAHGSPLFPMLHGSAPFFEKPPLKLWMGALAPYLFGDSNLTFRIADGLLGIVAVGLTFWLAQLMLSGAFGAFAATALVFYSSEWITLHHSFRHAVLDSLLTVLVLLAGLFSWRAYSLSQKEFRFKALLGFSLICGMAALVKSVAGLFPLFSVGALILLDKDEQEKRKSLIFAICPALIVFAAYIATLSFLPDRALKTFLGIEIFDRAFGGFTGHNTNDRMFYLRYLFLRSGAVPKICLLLGTAFCAASLPKDRTARFLLAWWIIPLAMLSLSQSKAPWYLNPYVPFMAITCVYGIQKCLNLPRHLTTRLAMAVVLTFVICVPFVRKINSHIDFVLNDTERLPFDSFVEQTATQPDRVTIVADAVSGRTSPIRGRFNVEGIYRAILDDKITAVRNPSDIALNPSGIFLVPTPRLAEIPPGWVLQQEIPPFKPREFPISVVRYDNGVTAQK